MKELIKIPGALILLLTGLTARAQYRSVDTDYIKPLPSCHWTNGNHFTMFINGNPVLEDAVTGEIVSSRYAYQALKQKHLRFFIRRSDIVYTDKAGKQQIVTGIDDPVFSPDSSAIAFTRNKDLYIFDTTTCREWQVTNDGSKDVYNGYAAWVYNEEILGRQMNYRAFWWSPDSRHIAFMHFDEKRVPVYDHFDDAGVHGKHVLIHYPQPGDPNPVVKIGIVDVAHRSLIWARYDSSRDQYFGMPYWVPDGSALWVQWMNRRQDTLKIDQMNLSDGSLRNIYTESQKTWIDLDKDNRVTFVPAKKIFLLMSDKSGWMHIYAYRMNGRFIRQLTSGNWPVTEISYVDEKKGWVYFTGHKESCVRSDLYKVKLDGTGLQRLTFGDYTHQVQLSPNGRFFITIYSNCATPAKEALLNTDGKLIRMLGDSKGDKFERYLPLVSRSEIIRVKTADGFDLPVRIHWPAKLDTTRKYPLIAAIYGGPGYAFVRDGYTGGMIIQDDTTSDRIVVQMDHRGSGQFGKTGENYMFHQLGRWEIEDYSTVIRYLEKKYPFIDTSRVAISGFSYGGYVTCLALCKAPDVFKFGLAGGSVTDWRLYDAPYTERYMGTPEENPDGYKNSSVMTYASNYRGLLRLAQGTMDDNVHMQNTMQLVSALEDAGKHFELMLYPGGHHGWLNLHEKYNHYRTEDKLFISKYLTGNCNQVKFHNLP